MIGWLLTCRLAWSLGGTHLIHLLIPGLLAQSESLTDRRINFPTWEQWQRVLLLQDYNTRVVILGTAMLGCAAGVVGCFTLLRKRALMGDALSHATLPGIAALVVDGGDRQWSGGRRSDPGAAPRHQA
jgi:manganese/zinc/iron transport system permease protein